VAEFHDLIHTFPILKPATIVKLFDNIDAWRKPQRVEQIALTSADVRGRTGFEACDYPQGRLLRKAWEVKRCRRRTLSRRDSKARTFAKS
jgi:tRNA nucleotidyltransferase (CCA-adding enzyme)